MPPPSRKCLVQTALLWEVATGNQKTDAYGEIQVQAPVEIPVRWETHQTESVSFQAQGATVAFEAVVLVDREIAVGSLLWLGSFSDWYGTGTGGDADGLNGELHQVNAYSEVPNVKGRDPRRIVKLIRYKDSLPTVV